MGDSSLSLTLALAALFLLAGCHCIGKPQFPRLEQEALVLAQANISPLEVCSFWGKLVSPLDPNWSLPQDPAAACSQLSEICGVLGRKAGWPK